MTESIENQSPLEGEVIVNTHVSVQLEDLEAMLEILRWKKPKRFELKSGITRGGKVVLELMYISENKE